MNKYFITGIGTDIGKTLASSILVELLNADYWKPVQTGNISDSDCHTVKNLITNSTSAFHKESYSYKAPLSPHLAAALENETIDINKISLPSTTNNNIIIEGAGGLLVPLARKTYVIDLAKKFDAEVILVCKNYLGCINHSLLSIDYLTRNNFKIRGLVLNGNFDPLVKEEIINYVDIPVLFEIPEFHNITKEVVLNFVTSIEKL